MIYFFTEQAILMRRSTVLNLPLQFGFPILAHTVASWTKVGYGREVLLKGKAQYSLPPH
jgi:hypothetical protein